MLTGVRRVSSTGEQATVVYEYRLDSFGTVVQTAGKERKNDDAFLGAWSNVMGPEIAKRHGMEWKPIPMGGSRTLTKADGREFLLGLLIKFARTSGYGYMEPIEG
jgi:hypothetical protein